MYLSHMERAQFKNFQQQAKQSKSVTGMHQASLLVVVEYLQTLFLFLFSLLMVKHVNLYWLCYFITTECGWFYFVT